MFFAQVHLPNEDGSYNGSIKKRCLLTSCANFLLSNAVQVNDMVHWFWI